MHRLATIFVAVLFSLPSTSLAGAAGAGIAGKVTDQTGASLPGATVDLQTVNGTLVASVATDLQGRYRFDTLLD
ncbi:MAG: carboxypeptidase-like regulatory domain-containing protein, partial [Vicinamibacterales bacterium]